MSVAATIAIQMQFSGAGGAWTTVTDVRLSDGFHLDYGIRGTGPLDRVASTGTCRFVLDNTATNSGALLGYYSPDNTNCRSGFGLGIGVRVALTYNGITYYKWRGLLDDIRPEGGTALQRRVFCIAVDWMEEAARWKASGVAAQVGQRSDQVIATLVSAMPIAPAATSYATGQSTFPYALDIDENGSGVPALSEFQRICNSEPGQLFLKGDTTQGGTLVFENRQTRSLVSTNAVTLSNTMIALDVSRSRNNLINKIQTITHPRQVDAAATTVLYSLQQPTTNAVAPGATAILLGPYRDPNQRAARVGGTAMVAPAATTDYQMFANADGTGTDLTATFTVVAALGGAGARFTITNTGATAGYITKLQCRGKGIYDYENAIMEANDSSSQTTFGENVVALDMWYQSDPVLGGNVADYFLHLYDSALSYVHQVGFFANISDPLMVAALGQEISARIGIVETVTGLTTVISGSAATKGYYINSVALDIAAGDNIYCTWQLAPADTFSYWLLGNAGASELGVTTRLGYL